MRRRQQGVALITAVMVVAFATTIAAGMLIRQNLAVHRTANLEQHAQAWWYLLGLEQWATRLLARDRQDNQIDSLGEAWAQPVDFIPVDEGALAGQIVDLQGRFNLNALAAGGEAGDLHQQQLVRLLQRIPDLQNLSAEALAASLRDWVDGNTEPSYPQGAEDGVYMSMQPPYRAANRAMESLSEVLLVDGVTRELWPLLEPHLTVLPDEKIVINVNTASGPVLGSLHEELSIADVEGLIARRSEAPFESSQEFLSDELLAGRQIPEGMVAVASQYFQARGSARIGNMNVTLSSLFRRDDNGRTTILRHAQGNL